MKISFVFALSLSFLVLACGKVHSVAGEYQESRSSKDATKVDPKVNEKEKEKEKEQAKGDAEKGKTLLKTCAGCHDSGMTKLNQTAIAKLEAAYSGAMASTHAPFKDSFEKQNRLDLEAALTLIVAP